MAVDNHGGLSIRRSRIGAWLGYLGSAALLVAALSGISTSFSAPLTLAAALTAAAGIVGWAVLAPEDFRGFITGRGVRYGTVAFFSTLLLIGIVALGYNLLARSRVSVDMTEGRRFTLDPASLRVLSRIRQPIQLTGFYTSNELPEREVDDRYYQLYAEATNGLVRVQYYNPDELPAMAALYGANQTDRIFISALTETGEVDFSTLARVPRNNVQEREITSAIARLLIAGQIVVYFDTGHGERSPIDQAQEGLSGINNGMRESGVRTYTLNLAELAASGSAIPDDASALLFARPLNDLSEAEVGVLDAYLTRGGSLLLLPDVTFTPGTFMQEGGPLNTYLWENYGIRALDAAVIDYASSQGTALDLISALVFAESDITARLDPANGTPALFRLARALQINLEDPPPDIANGRLILSSDQSYGERDLTTLGQTNTYEFTDGEDQPGPQDVAVFAYHSQTDARIVLIGDSDFVTNGQVSSAGNGILFTDALAWLTRLREELNYAPQAYTSGLPLLYIDPGQFNLIVAAVVVGLPGAVALLGLFIGRRRARR